MAVVFFLLAGASFYNSNKNPIKQIKQIQLSPTISVRLNPSPTITLFPTIYNNSQQITTVSPSPSPIQLIQPAPTDLTVNGHKISLTINGSSVGSFNIPQGSNQCDVLSHALSQGKIQSLNMRYNNDMGTNAVYQINGVGKENAVWWTFKVNGQSPSQGCSYIKVGNDDKVEWSYLGS